MLSKRPDLPFLLSAASAALLLVMPSLQRSYRSHSRRMVPNGRPFGERRSSEEALSLELQRAQEHDRGRHATQPMQIPRKGWYDILWRTYQEMQQDRLLSIAGGVSFFTLLAIFPAITALVSAYGLFFNPATDCQRHRAAKRFGAC
jgi:membrane protein